MGSGETVVQIWIALCSLKWAHNLVEPKFPETSFGFREAFFCHSHNISLRVSETSVGNDPRSAEFFKR